MSGVDSKQQKAIQDRKSAERELMIAMVFMVVMVAIVASGIFAYQAFSRSVDQLVGTQEPGQ